MKTSPEAFKVPSYAPDDFRKRGIERAHALLGRLNIEPEDLRGAKLLDLGCGLGETASAAACEFGAEVVGVDPYDRTKNLNFAKDFKYLNIGVEELGPEYNESFDFAQSYAVLEHIPDPVKALRALHRVLKPGGKAFLQINLWRGASASHSNHIVFDWCHLLLEWSEIERICKEKKGRLPVPVNKLSYLEYIHHVNDIGFGWIKPAWFQRRPITEEFYQANFDKLQWYPRAELDLDFILLSLYKKKDDEEEQAKAPTPPGMPVAQPTGWTWDRVVKAAQRRLKRNG